MTNQQIIELLGVSESSNEYKLSLLSQIAVASDLKFVRIIDELMSEEEKNDFEGFSEGKSPQEILAWLNERMSDVMGAYESIVRSIVAELKNQQLEA